MVRCSKESSNCAERVARLALSPYRVASTGLLVAWERLAHRHTSTIQPEFAYDAPTPGTVRLTSTCFVVVPLAKS